VVILLFIAFRHAIRHRVSRQARKGNRFGGRFDVITVLALVLVIIPASCFAFMNAHWSFSWDGFLIWATKAQVLYVQGDLSPEPQLWQDAAYLQRYATYPTLVPLSEALMSMTHRRFDFDRSKTVFFLFYVSMLLSTYRAGRILSTPRLGLLGAALTAWIPQLSATVESFGGYADIPQACFAVAVAASLLDSSEDSGWRSPEAWLIGSLVMVKNEGIILLPIACFAVFCCWLSRPIAAVWKKVLQHREALGVITGLFLLRVGYLRWLAFPDTEFLPLNWSNLLRAGTVAGEVIRLCVARLLSFERYGLFWIAFVVFGAFLFVQGSKKERVLVIAVALSLVAYVSIFLFTTWDIAVHVSTAFDRLTIQIVPVAAVCIVAGYYAARLRWRSKARVGKFDATNSIGHSTQRLQSK
jgi:hypothetical protein